MQYKTHDGMAFMKKKRQYAKVHVSNPVRTNSTYSTNSIQVKGRVMIDPSTFRRINPNYLVSSVKSRNNDEEDDAENNYFDVSEDSSEAGSDDCDGCCCCDGEGEDGEAAGAGETAGGEDSEMKQAKFVIDDKGDYHIITKGEEIEKAMQVERVAEEESEPVFTDDELLLASPVVLGWAFNEKLWREDHRPL